MTISIRDYVAHRCITWSTDENDHPLAQVEVVNLLRECERQQHWLRVSQRQFEAYLDMSSELREAWREFQRQGGTTATEFDLFVADLHRKPHRHKDRSLRRVRLVAA